MAITTNQITITTMEGWYSGATPPLNPLIGDLWLDTTSNEIKKYDGTNWIKQADTQGPQGPKGDSIKSREAYWIKSSTKPDKPDSSSISNWTLGSEPPENALSGISASDKFWRAYKDTYSNEKSEYSEVELIGSYEVLNGLVQFRNGVSTTENKEGQNITVIDGGKIKTGSIDAKKIHMEDLEALKATIGGFHIGKNSIYSGNKKTIDSTERGIYFDSNGQSYFGDDKNFIRFYRSDKDNYKLQISADSLTFGSGVSVEKAFEDIKGDIQNAQGTANEAAKTASNYITSSKYGLMVSKNTGEVKETPTTATSRNILITGDNFQIRDGQKVLASYGEDTTIGDLNGGNITVSKNGIELSDGTYKAASIKAISEEEEVKTSVFVFNGQEAENISLSGRRWYATYYLDDVPSKIQSVIVSGPSVDVSFPNSPAGLLYGYMQEGNSITVAVDGSYGDASLLHWSLCDTLTVVYTKAARTTGVITGEEIYANNVFVRNPNETYVSILDFIYPVGSIYMSVNSADPGTLFGGTWERIQDTFLLASGSTYGAGTTGGSAKATLPSHTHTFGSRGYQLWSAKIGKGSTEPGNQISGDKKYYAAATGGSTSNYKWLESVDSKGASDVSQANMPPYLAVNVWKRIS